MPQFILDNLKDLSLFGWFLIGYYTGLTYYTCKLIYLRYHQK